MTSKGKPLASPSSFKILLSVRSVLLFFRIAGNGGVGCGDPIKIVHHVVKDPDQAGRVIPFDSLQTITGIFHGIEPPPVPFDSLEELACGEPAVGGFCVWCRLCGHIDSGIKKCRAFPALNKSAPAPYGYGETRQVIAVPNKKTA